MSILRFRDLQTLGIFANGMALSRGLKQYDFPAPLELGRNTIGWDSGDVDAWLASRPRRRPKRKLATAAAPLEADGA